MSIDVISEGSDFPSTGFASATQIESEATTRPDATRSDSPFGDDTIANSPLTYFGGVVTQIGHAMVQSQQDGDAANGDMSKAIELLEGVIGLMSGVEESGTSISDVQQMPYLMQ